MTKREIKQIDKALNILHDVLGNHFEKEITDYDILESLIGADKANEITDLLVTINKLM